MRVFLAVIVAILGLASVQPNNDALTSFGNGFRKIQQNFFNFFDSIGKNDGRQSETYRDILEKETRHEQQAFDSMKNELRSARRQNVKQRRLTDRNGHTDVEGAALKRDAKKNDGEWWKNAERDPFFGMSGIERWQFELEEQEYFEEVKRNKSLAAAAAAAANATRAANATLVGSTTLPANVTCAATTTIKSTPSVKPEDQAVLTPTETKNSDEDLNFAVPESNYTEVTLNFKAKYMDKGYIKWQKLHEATPKELETLCSKYALMLSGDERQKFTARAIKSYQDKYLLMGHDKSHFVEVDTLTCLVTFLDKKGKESSRMRYYLTEGHEPNTAFRFALLQTTAVLTRFLRNIWAKEEKSPDYNVLLKIRIHNTTAKVKMTKPPKGGKKMTKAAVTNATEEAGAEATTVAGGKDKKDKKDKKKKKGGKKE